MPRATTNATPSSPPAKPKRISHAEWDLLDALWSLGPSTAPRLTEHLREAKAWANSTVKTMLDRMAAKGLVRARQVGNVWEYTPAVEPHEAQRSAWKRFVEAAFGGAIAPALQFVVRDSRLTRKEREALLAILKSDDSKEKSS